MSQVSASSLIAGRYRLDSHVAADPFAEVWRGTDADLARPVAIKMLDGAADADAVRQFREGASRAASLSHEGVVRIFDYCEAEPSEPAQRPLLVMGHAATDRQPWRVIIGSDGSTMRSVPQDSPENSARPSASAGGPQGPFYAVE